ncbi:hypothetical protein CERZMDRAFT_89292 [Cercospora zeae-maydis SCOH1-5]|uniref:Uncharacterized protein n=1 Tax=Cercospora zeae-maydis SCOH1-5 TaxID=717836 RepID=A0A6A6EZT6_9PEZI|nr:hypothetical protein CERZMDRAFT_89292 [Cercospora zeae-maydis SCOH1-5]
MLSSRVRTCNVIHERRCDISRDRTRNVIHKRRWLCCIPAFTLSTVSFLYHQKSTPLVVVVHPARAIRLEALIFTPTTSIAYSPAPYDTANGKRRCLENAKHQVIQQNGLIDRVAYETLEDAREAIGAGGSCSGQGFTGESVVEGRGRQHEIVQAALAMRLGAVQVEVEGEDLCAGRRQC